PAPGVSSKRLTMYEGGWGYIPSANALTATSYDPGTGPVALTAANRDAFYASYYRTSLYANLLTDYLNAFAAAGGEYPSQYSLVGTWATSGMWGVVQPNMYGSQIPTYSALRSFNGA